jgi:hypothetical protein
MQHTRKLRETITGSQRGVQLLQCITDYKGVVSSHTDGVPGTPGRGWDTRSRRGTVVPARESTGRIRLPSGVKKSCSPPPRVDRYRAARPIRHPDPLPGTPGWGWDTRRRRGTVVPTRESTGHIRLPSGVKKTCAPPPRVDRYRAARPIRHPDPLPGTPGRDWDTRRRRGTVVPARESTGRIRLPSKVKKSCAPPPLFLMTSLSNFRNGTRPEQLWSFVQNFCKRCCVREWSYRSPRRSEVDWKDACLEFNLQFDQKSSMQLTMTIRNRHTPTTFTSALNVTYNDEQKSAYTGYIQYP